ncbi:MAG: myo-inosose-2 dehydratase, partial [Marinovum sp.]|nr:myo-inosose-2 dehydratase [Marinovum sp.]
QDPTKAPPYDYSKMGYNHIVKVCKKADISIN